MVRRVDWHKVCRAPQCALNKSCEHFLGSPDCGAPPMHLRVNGYWAACGAQIGNNSECRVDLTCPDCLKLTPEQLGALQVRSFQEVADLCAGKRKRKKQL